MIKQIINTMTFKGKAFLVTAIAFFTFYGLSGAAIMILVLDMLQTLTGPGKADAVLYPYWVLLVILIVFKAFCNIVADMAKHYAGFDVVEQLREKIILRLKRFSLGFYTKERLGEISTIIHKDVNNMEGVVGHMWSRMGSDFVIALILGTALFIVDYRMGLAMISLLPVALMVLAGSIRSAGSLHKRSQDELADMVSLFVEYVKGIPVLKAFLNNSSFEEKVRTSAQKFGESSKEMSKVTATYLGKYSLLLELCFALLATLGAYFVYRDNLSVFKYLMFIILSREFYKPFVNMEAHWLNYIKVTDSYRRIRTILDGETVPVPAHPKKIAGFNIAFEKVCFFYEQGEFELSNADFHLKEKSLTALVGPSGSGKTTITSLLLRFWDIHKGTIRIGGTDIRNADYDDLLAGISIVMQNVILFADTIYNNIKLGKARASREEVIEAAQKAMIHDFIMTLPRGYETPVGENGVGLSGGQKQRISIARAFLKDAPIVILDEITSNVDPVNEAKIQQAVSNLARERTVLVIAHHLRTIRTADMILVFDHGSIVERGTHEKLLEQEGLYHRLWQAQEEAREWQIANEEDPDLEMAVTR